MLKVFVATFVVVAVRARPTVAARPNRPEFATAVVIAPREIVSLRNPDFTVRRVPTPDARVRRLPVRVVFSPAPVVLRGNTVARDETFVASRFVAPMVRAPELPEPRTAATADHAQHTHAIKINNVFLISVNHRLPKK